MRSELSIRPASTSTPPPPYTSTAQFTPASTQASNFSPMTETSYSAHSSAAEAYFESREPQPGSSRRPGDFTTVTHHLVIPAYATTADDLQIHVPRCWRHGRNGIDINQTDMATFGNFLLPPPPSPVSPVAKDEEPKSLAHFENEAERMGRLAVVADDWNRNFFEPRGCKVELVWDADLAGPMCETCAAVEGDYQSPIKKSQTKAWSLNHAGRSASRTIEPEDPSALLFPSNEAPPNTTDRRPFSHFKTDVERLINSYRRRHAHHGIRDWEAGPFERGRGRHSRRHGGRARSASSTSSSSSDDSHHHGRHRHSGRARSASTSSSSSSSSSDDSHHHRRRRGGKGRGFGRGRHHHHGHGRRGRSSSTSSSSSSGSDSSSASGYSHGRRSRRARHGHETFDGHHHNHGHHLAKLHSLHHGFGRHGRRGCRGRGRRTSSSNDPPASSASSFSDLGKNSVPMSDEKRGLSVVDEAKLNHDDKPYAQSKGDLRKSGGIDKTSFRQRKRAARNEFRGMKNELKRELSGSVQELKRDIKAMHKAEKGKDRERRKSKA